MKILWALALVWVVCSVLAYGFTLGYWNHRFPYFNRTRFAALFSVLGGPVSLAVALVAGNWHFRLRPLSKEQAWREHRRHFPLLDYEDFEDSWK